MSILMPEHRERAIGAGQDYVRTTSGIYVPDWADVPVAAPQPLAIGLFSGAGGMDCGLAMAGFHVVAGAEWWPVAAETYLCNLGSPETLVYVGEKPGDDWTKKDRARFAPYAGVLVAAGELFESKVGDRTMRPGDGWISQRSDHEANTGACANHIGAESPAGDPAPVELREWFHNTYCLGGRDFDVQPCELFLLCDVHELTGAMLLELLGCESDDVALVAGGPPCQGFSRSNGKRSRHDGRNQLVFEFARLVVEIHPKAMMMENVPGIVDMVTPEGVPVLDALALILENGGMGTYEALRRSLAANAGAGAIVKGAKRPAKSRRPEADDEDDQLEHEAQLALEVS